MFRTAVYHHRFFITDGTGRAFPDAFIAALTEVSNPGMFIRAADGNNHTGTSNNSVSIDGGRAVC